MPSPLETRIGALNIICYTICILCIVAGTVLALMMIWVSIDPDTLRKTFLTVTVFFLASALTLGVNRTMTGRRH